MNKVNCEGGATAAALFPAALAIAGARQDERTGRGAGIGRGGPPTVGPETREAPGRAPAKDRRAMPRGDEPRRLVLSPLCWLKLQLFLHGGDTEVGGFGVSSARDLLYLEEFRTVRQRVTPVTVAFDDAAVADYYDDCVDEGLLPGRFARVWVHTHPGDSPDPSFTDEQTFARVFGGCDWAVMLIASRTGRAYCRLSFSAGPGGSVLLPVSVDWAAWPDLLLEQAGEVGELFESWMDEYGVNVQPEPLAYAAVGASGRAHPSSAAPAPWSRDWWLEDEAYQLAPYGFEVEADEPYARRTGHERLADLLEAAGEVWP
jgi:proteasome lid subunit RPN8/RPN11